MNISPQVIIKLRDKFPSITPEEFCSRIQLIKHIVAVEKLKDETFRRIHPAVEK